MTQPISNEEQLRKQQEFLHRARKGVLAFLIEKGGKLSMAELHDFSLNKFFIQHQGFSKLMEFFVGDGLVEYDYATESVTITEAGKKFASS